MKTFDITDRLDFRVFFNNNWPSIPDYPIVRTVGGYCHASDKVTRGISIHLGKMTLSIGFGVKEA